MEKNYKEILHNQSKKRNAFFSIIEKDTFYMILFIIGCCIISCSIGMFYYNYKADSIFIEQAPNILKFFGCMIFGFITLIIICAFFYGIWILYNYLHHLFTVEIPVLLNKRYLPLTDEEIKNLNLNTKEFAEFIEFCCSIEKKQKDGSIKREYSKYILKDIIYLINEYCEINNFTEKQGLYMRTEEVTKYFTKEMHDHLRVNI